MIAARRFITSTVPSPLRWTGRKIERRAVVGGRGPNDAAARRCESRQLLSDVPGAGCPDRLAARIEHRSASRAVRDHSGDRCDRAHLHRCDCVVHGLRCGGDLSVAGRRMLRPRIPAGRERTRIALSFHLSVSRRSQSRCRVSSPGNADGGRADDAACRRGSTVGAHPPRP